MAALARVELGGQEDDGGFQEIEHCCHGRAPAFEERVGHITGDQRAGRGHERDQEREKLELGGLQIHVVKVLHVAGEPLVHRLPHRAGAGVGAGRDPHRRVGQDGTNDLGEWGRSRRSRSVQPVSSPMTPWKPASSGVSFTVSAMPTATAAQISDGVQNSQRQCSGGM